MIPRANMAAICAAQQLLPPPLAYATLDPGRTSSRLILSNSNRTATCNASDNGISVGSLAFAPGKWYWELLMTQVAAGARVGMCKENASLDTWLSNIGTDYISIQQTGTVAVNAATTESSPGIGFANGDVMMFAWDEDAARLWIGKNGTWSAAGNPGSGTGHNFLVTSPGVDWRPAFSLSGNGNNVTARFSPPFSYVVPSGFSGGIFDP